MIDVKAIFSRNCGDRVTYLTHEFRGLTLRIQYVVDGQLGTPRWIEMKCTNGSDRELNLKAATAGTQAAQKAYAVSGQRDRDIEASLQGKLT